MNETIEYKLIGKNNRLVTLDNMKETNESIGNIFPEIDSNKMRDELRKTYGINGETFYVYYRDRDSRIILQKKYEDSIKERLEVLVELKFMSLK
jgi:hypothetical protein